MSTSFDKFIVKNSIWAWNKFKIQIDTVRGKTKNDSEADFLQDEIRQFIESAIREKLERLEREAGGGK